MDSVRWTSDPSVLYKEMDGFLSFVPTPMKLPNQNFNATTRGVIALSGISCVLGQSVTPLYYGAAAIALSYFAFPVQQQDSKSPSGHIENTPDTSAPWKTGTVHLADVPNARVVSIRQKTADPNARLFSQMTTARDETPQPQRIVPSVTQMVDASKPKPVSVANPFISQLESRKTSNAASGVQRFVGSTAVTINKTRTGW